MNKYLEKLASGRLRHFHSKADSLASDAIELASSASDVHNAYKKTHKKPVTITTPSKPKKKHT